ncbi:response regulator transcription factor [Tessaracoccus sp. SD287]|uniref:winged helix-turn-helix transcriptional regulator n=1 Tax=Tessaracoccus sp. SD287 TaxID=2782008 RepID=UPI001A974123|nr:response regulator transcription factor [Tessaracoccus sp. SD287]MBO1031992.1 response regulator transcription factor [Tessaracoccus sp. SD287]
MASIVVLVGGDAAPLPDALTLLPHTLDVRTELPADHSPNADLVLVDAREDPAQGRDLCVHARARADQPILLMVSTATLAVLQRAWGFDDFVVDRAPAAEFDARVRLLTTSGPASNMLSQGPIVIDEDAYTVTAGGAPLNLTYTEFELLKHLVSHPGRVLSREHLLSQVWGYDYYGGTRTVDVHIRRLRAKLAPEHDGHITTVRNVGYRFTANREL